MQMRLRFFALLCFALSACPSGPAPSDAGPTTDAGPSDAGPQDTGRQTIGPNPCGCTGIQVCDPEFLDCIEPEECIEDEDCRGDRICVRGGCYDCWGDELAACVGGQLCRDGACVSAGACEEDYDCVDGLSCDEDRRCSPPEPCDADELEPNDHPLQARRVGGVRRGLWTCAVGDWYKVRQRKSALIVRLRPSSGSFEPANTPIVTLFDAAARRALATGSLEGDQIVTGILGEPQGEDLLVHVMSPEPLRYDLSIKHSDEFCPVIDAEPNHSTDMAVGLTLGMELQGSLCPVAGDDEDLDLYRLQAAAGQRIGFMVEQGGAEQVFLSLRDANGQTLGEELTLDQRHSRGLLGTVVEAGSIYVGLRGAGAAYRLRIGLFSPAGACEDDAQEPDDQADFAQRLGAEAVEGVLCPSSLDHLGFDAQGEDGMHLVVTELEGSNSSWMLRSPSGQGMGLRRSGNTLRLDRQRMGETGRYLLVGAGSTERSRYRVELELVSGGACTPDVRDPADDERSGATPLRLYQGSNILTACDDADWFSVSLPQGAGRIAMRRFSSGDAPISLELFAAEAELPLASTLINSSEGALPLQLDAAGDYFLRVMGDSHESNRYQLMALGPPPANDTCANPGAVRLSRGQSQEIMGSTQGAHDNAESNCGGARAGDVQYFVQVPEGGGRVTFELETLADEQGRRTDHLISLSRLCGEASELLCDDDSDGNYHDRLEADLEAGIYTLSVDTLSSFSGGSPFRLRASVGAVEDRLPLIAAGDGCGAGIPTIALPPGERGEVTIASTTEGLSDAARGSCGFNIEGRDAFFAFELSAPARVQARIPYAGRSSVYLRAAACTLPVDLACSFSWRGNQDMALGTLPAGRYVLVYDRMSTLDGPFTLSLTLSDP